MISNMIKLIILSLAAAALAAPQQRFKKLREDVIDSGIRTKDLSDMASVEARFGMFYKKIT